MLLNLFPELTDYIVITPYALPNSNPTLLFGVPWLSSLRLPNILSVKCIFKSSYIFPNLHRKNLSIGSGWKGTKILNIYFFCQLAVGNHHSTCTVSPWPSVILHHASHPLLCISPCVLVRISLCYASIASGLNLECKLAFAASTCNLQA